MGWVTLIALGAWISLENDAGSLFLVEGALKRLFQGFIMLSPLEAEAFPFEHPSLRSWRRVKTRKLDANLCF